MNPKGTEISQAVSRNGRRLIQIIVGTIVIALTPFLLIILAFWLFTSPYQRFIEGRDQKYYQELARACDVVFTQHPIGTNLFIQVEVTNASLPEVIRDLEPSQITIFSNGVSVISWRKQFGLSWTEQGDDTNVWNLSVCTKGPLTIVYREKRTELPDQN